MGDVVNFPISLDSDLGRELIVNCCQFAENILTEQQVRKKYRFDEAAWEALGTNDELVEKIEAEKIRRIRDGSSKREKSQQLITKAPGIFGRNYERSGRITEAPSRRNQNVGFIYGQRSGRCAGGGQIRDPNKFGIGHFDI